MLLGLLLMASCNKEIEVGDVHNFDVTTETSTYKVGEEIRFAFTGGSVHNISFYSGETRKDFNFKDGRTVNVSDTGATMSFQSSVQLGTQANQVSILSSTDFNGDYSSLASVKAATWTDITSRFVLGTGTAFLASGTKDISDLIVPGKPIYFAFKYLTKPQETNGLARTWYIQLFSIMSYASLDGTIALPLTDQASAGFRIVDENPVNAPALSTITTTRITLVGNRYKVATDPLFDPTNPIYDPLNPIYDPNSTSYVPTAVRPTFIPFDPSSPYNDPLSEHWAVSRALRTDSVDLGPDWATPLKGVTTATMTEYRYKYTKPGTYNVVFVAANNSIDKVKKVVKELTLTITE
ncbi:MAG: DUF5017 domain-containing protein [Bacteroidales bacterium]|nr:DUF5017 domain-containing protein [Bacteroidales bacterium]